MLATHVPDVDLDADLEQEQHDADVGEELDLVAVRDVAGRERRDDQARHEIADHRGKAQPARDPSERRRQQERQADVEQEVAGVHGTRIPAGRISEPGGGASGLGWRRLDEGQTWSSRSRSIAASSSGVPWTLGPLNQFFAEAKYQIAAPPRTTRNTTGV